MAQTTRPLSPHLQIYKWQSQMVTSILHRATGIALAVGSLVILWGLVALSMGPDAWASFHAVAASPLGLALLFAWTWALWFHFINGIRHLYQDAGAGYAISTFIKASWFSIIGSLVLTLATWAYVFMGGAA
ncbi:succinate dehydrogenase, cytochrome b556 subunit [Pinirhizobacter soli]|uniref:succinate dehydrogenase, cytochrome b556 subunit n=1 Tax=Pinirhizobacter soli TaxID=2786953 RepID=UPI002029C4EA|nr:succinate dehydrogenase, cytochrome b556 subunit [Pinirhizobacter soli]